MKITLHTRIKEDLLSARRNKDTQSLKLLSTLLGETQRHIPPAERDEEIVPVLRKMVENLRSTANLLSPDDSRLAEYHWQEKQLQRYLPKELSSDDIKNKLDHVKNDICSAKSEGQAVGLAMKELKSQGILPEGKLVKQVVQSLRE